MKTTQEMIAETIAMIEAAKKATTLANNLIALAIRVGK